MGNSPNHLGHVSWCRKPNKAFRVSEEWPSVDLTDPISIVLKGDDVYGEGLCDKPHFRGDSLKAVFRIVVCVCVCGGGGGGGCV